MLALGIDVGTSFIKVSVYNAATSTCIASTQYPEIEQEIISKNTNWAEQNPLTWWHNVKQAILKLNAQNKYNPKDIKAIGIAYQMHGLVCIDKNKNVLRDSIIWCDSRAVNIGNKAFAQMGENFCLQHLLNSPSNFTASKLAWIKENETEIYNDIDKIMLPGDFIAMQLTGEVSTTISALSEGIFWDFKHNEISNDILKYFGFDFNIFPTIKNVFEEHGKLKKDVANELDLQEGIVVTYKAGDQPNNAFSLNVSKAGEVAATAGTSGVIYAVTDSLFYDKQSRVNTFAHVNHKINSNSLGALMCINGTGILYKFIKSIIGENLSYTDLNTLAASIAVGSDGVIVLPFGNGAERILNNRIVDSHILNLNFNIHNKAHIIRATLEGIVFAFCYGLEIMQQNGMQMQVIKAPKANLFLSEVFVETFVNTTGLTVELYDCDGSVGAAIGACIGANYFKNENEAFKNMKPLQVIKPNTSKAYIKLFENWKTELNKLIK